MRSTIFGLSAIALAAVSVPALAQGSDVSLSATAAITSDYRFRGVSQTDKRVAVQGSLTATHTSGFYATVWGSSIEDYVAAGSNAEVDLMGGYSAKIGEATVDAGAVYYYYPGSGGANTDFVETFASVSAPMGPLTGKVGIAYAPKQSALSIGSGKEDNLYLYTDLTAPVGSTGLSVTGHFGHSFGPSYITLGDEYSDWGAGFSYTLKGFTLGLSYVDTDKSSYSPVKLRNVSKAGVVASASYAF